MRSKLLVLLFAAFVNAPFASAQCVPKRPFCEALPDHANPNAAVFLGSVKEVAPAPPLVLPPTAPGNSSPGVAQARRRAGDRVVEPPMRYPVVRLEVLDVFRDGVGRVRGALNVRSLHRWSTDAGPRYASR
jgi:hypothetical protein